jgi:hypothetical protein
MLLSLLYRMPCDTLPSSVQERVNGKVRLAFPENVREHALRVFFARMKKVPRRHKLVDAQRRPRLV